MINLIYEGVLSEGNPTGQTTKFGGVDAYIAGNLESKKSAIVIATDVFGYSFINIQVMADTMTKQTGVPTVVPDIFDNFPLPINAMSLEQEARTKVQYTISLIPTLFSSLLNGVLSKGDLMENSLFSTLFSRNSKRRELKRLAW